ncbi:MAG: hypothetical protein ACRDE5_12275, partial [Ginsengibacter sp.]
TVPDFKTTEEWMQLVMHEYFHSYQFSNSFFIRYFKKKIKVKEDSLNAIYSENKWFANYLAEENDCLLTCIATANTDSLKNNFRRFINYRLARQKRFKALFKYDIGPFEDFWEKVEGTARYIEYYTGLSYAGFHTNSDTRCDPFFDGFKRFTSQADLPGTPNFIIRTKIMRAYYYVTGFNMCRLLDKLNVNYKNDLFNSKNKSLFKILTKSISHLGS